MFQILAAFPAWGQLGHIAKNTSEREAEPRMVPKGPMPPACHKWMAQRGNIARKRTVQTLPPLLGFRMEVCALFQRVADVQQIAFFPGTANQLQTQRQAVPCQPDGN